jgi:hypothetical protein
MRRVKISGMEFSANWGYKIKSFPSVSGGAIDDSILIFI